MTSTLRTVPLSAARRIALAAQGFDRPRPEAVGPRHLLATARRLQVVQIDSVNVLARSQYLPFFSRLGPYDTADLDRLRDGAGPRARTGRRLVETWAHEASLVPVEVWPLLTPRKVAAAGSERATGIDAALPGLRAEVLAILEAHGPQTSREVEAHLPDAAGRPTDHWGWNWSGVKRCLELLFATGEVVSAGRSSSFERRYAVPSRVLPPAVVAGGPGGAAAPSAEEAHLEMVRRSVRAVGIGTTRCVLDYFRLRGPGPRAALAALVAAGEVEEVVVPGWKGPVYLDPTVRRPRAVPGAALLSPFDSLVWQRERVEALWGFRFRLEIYVPAAQRVHGYYVLPFLLDEHLLGRVDLKADRAAGVLRAQAVHWEPGADVAHALPRLVGELESMASWMGLGRIDLPV